MGTKKEVYYKFFFPNYNSLSTSTSGSNFIPDSDGVDQSGEVRALCNECPERVITYDQLKETNSNNLISMYKTAWETNRPQTQIFSRSFIKKCIDKYLEFPKYFNLRNYWDANVCQEGGMSLMVSDSPEVGGDYGGYTRFTIKENDNDENELEKYVYCSVMISSGDFFYSFCLPSDILNKSGLLDEVVTSKFHSNWYLKNGSGKGWFDYNDEKNRWWYYSSTIGHPRNPGVNTEKSVFVPHYFLQGNVVPLGKKWSGDGEDTLVDLHFDPNDPEYTSADRRVYSNQYVTRTNLPCTDNDLIGLPYGSTGRNISGYNSKMEDLKRDFIELEATRRILYYNENDSTKLKYTDGSIRTIHSTSDIPHIVSGFGYNTVLSFNAPDEYINDNYTYTYTTYEVVGTTTNPRTGEQEDVYDNVIHEEPAHGTPPLQIPYDLLRYCLNDRPPFTDCETVLVMWIATPYKVGVNKITPDTISTGDVAALNRLNWQQYAIPISCRCCFKNSTDTDSFIQGHQGSHKHVHNRFLVKYPFNYWSIGNSNSYSTFEENSNLVYRYHTRRAGSYKATDSSNVDFKEVLFLQDLVHYSDNYIIVYQNTNYLNYGFDIQGYLLKKYSNAFKQLYVEKTYYNPGNGYNGTEGGKGNSNNHENQLYYIKVDEIYADEQNNTIQVFDINTNGYSSSNRRICICKPSTTDVFKPSDVIYRLNINDQKWDPHGSVAASRKVKILNKIRDFNFDDVTYYKKYGYNDWRIADNYFFTLFDANYKVGDTKIFTKHTECQFSIINSDQLHTTLNWDDIYISSFGISQYNPVYIDALYHHTGQGIAYYSLGILDNYIALDGVAYGSTTNGKIIVGFENMLDFNYEDAYHFKYYAEDHMYKPVNKIINTNYSYDITVRSNNYTCIAYTVDYNS